MANYTKNFNLEKPAQEDFYNVEVQNRNMDKIDEELNKRVSIDDWEKVYGEHNKPTMDDLDGTLPISKGGTGATSAAAARANIQAAKTVHKHNASDIDSGTLSSDRFPTIPITKGGTGAADSSKARENLGIRGEYFVFTLEDGSTVTKLVYVG